MTEPLVLHGKIVNMLLISSGRMGLLLDLEGEWGQDSDGLLEVYRSALDPWSKKSVIVTIAEAP